MPAGRHVSHVDPCPYIAPTPVTDASHITKIVSGFRGSIGTSTGVVQHTCFTISKQCWCMGRHENGCPFAHIPAKGPVYCVMFGRKCARYWTSPRTFALHDNCGAVSSPVSVPFCRHRRVDPCRLLYVQGSQPPWHTTRTFLSSERILALVFCQIRVLDVVRAPLWSH